MNIKYPTISYDINNYVFVSFYKDNKRYRISNGDKIGIDLKPNSFPIEKRNEMGKILASEVYKFLQSHKPLISRNKLEIDDKNDLDYLYLALQKKLNSNLSTKYLSTLEFIYQKICEYSSEGQLDKHIIKQFLNSYSNPTSYNTIRVHLSALISEAMELGLKHNPMQHIKRRRQEEKLHKPFNNLKDVLDDIKLFNTNLYICCLITYGCLLRPHREIRELKWMDFSDDLGYIYLSGNRNKSKKNRIVPVPDFIIKEIKPNRRDLNIFSNKEEPYNESYFKSLWSNYKKQSACIEKNQTLYSFRHSGAINIFKRTGSLRKLQAALGHSSLEISLIYLRNLELCQLKKEDMPEI